MFDTLSYAEDLVEIGVPESQSRLQAKVLSKAFASNNLATKTDIAELRAEVKTDIAELRADFTKLRADVKTDIIRLESKVSDVKFELIKWVAGMSFATMGVMFALLRFMLPLENSISSIAN